MKTYEITFITKPLDSARGGEKPAKKLIEDLGGKILNISSIGEKAFAYPIKKETKGFYTTFAFEIEPEKLLELNKKLGLQEDILRHLIIIGKTAVTEIPELKPAKGVKVTPRATGPELEIPAPKTEKMIEAPKEEKKIEKPKKVEKETVKPVVKPVKKAEKVTPTATSLGLETESEEDRLKALDKKLDELLKE